MTTVERACPYCDTILPEDTTICPSCGEDVAGLLHLAYAHAIYYNEALELAQRGELEQARDALLVCLRLNANYAPGYALMARLAARRGDWNEAREYTSRAKALAPTDDTLDALLEAIDEGEAHAAQAQEAAAEEQRMQGGADEHAGTERQRQIFHAALLGAAIGGALSHLLAKRSGRRSNG